MAKRRPTSRPITPSERKQVQVAKDKYKSNKEANRSKRKKK